MQYYRKIMNLIETYFKEKNWQKYFLKGGCYWLADFLNHGIKDSVIMINRMEEHCAIYFCGGLYDVTGRISAKNYVVAGKKEIFFMKKNYVPKFDTHEVLRYLENNL